MLHLNFTSIIPHKLTDKLKGFKMPTVDKTFTSIIPHKLADTLKGFKFPSVDSTRIKKFFYEAYLDVHEDDSLEELKAKVKSKK